MVSGGLHVGVAMETQCFTGCCAGQRREQEAAVCGHPTDTGNRGGRTGSYKPEALSLLALSFRQHKTRP